MKRGGRRPPFHPFYLTAPRETERYQGGDSPSMIRRAVAGIVEERMRSGGLAMVVGAGQTGKTALCRELARANGFGYASMAYAGGAPADPDEFLAAYPPPIVIDDAELAPELFEALLDEAEGLGAGMPAYLLVCGQPYELLHETTRQSAGEVPLVRVHPLSVSEALGRPDTPFLKDPGENLRRARESPLDRFEVASMMARGTLPELVEKPAMKSAAFYAGYLESSLGAAALGSGDEEEGARLRQFLKALMATAGEEASYEALAKDAGVPAETARRWVGILEAGGVVRTVRPYVDRLCAQGPGGRFKAYLCDTGLACHLLGVADPEDLLSSALLGPVFEAFATGEVLKSYSNSGEPCEFYYHGDAGGRVDLVVLSGGMMHLVQCRPDGALGPGDAEAMRELRATGRSAGSSCVLSLDGEARAAEDGTLALPVCSI